MKDFLLNILPRIKSYSKELDISESIIDKPWVWIGDNGVTEKFIFRRGGELLMVQKGVIQIGKWELITSLNSLLIDRNVDKLLMNYAFVNDSIMLLKLDHSADNKIIPLVNETALPLLDYKSYLNKLSSSDSNTGTLEDIETYFDIQDYSTKMKAYVFSTLDQNTNNYYIYDEIFKLKKTIYVNGGIIKTGYYKMPPQDYMNIPIERRTSYRLYYIVNGIISDVFEISPVYFTVDDKAVSMHKNIFSGDKNAAIFYTKSFRPFYDGKFSTGLFSSIIIKDGRVS